VWWKKRRDKGGRCVNISQNIIPVSALPTGVPKQRILIRQIQEDKYSQWISGEWTTIGFCVTLLYKELGYPGYQSLQTLYNLYDRADYETDLGPFCRAEGLGVITYFSLASGFLTGKYRTENDLSKSARGGMVMKYLNARGLRILKALDLVAKQYDSTPAIVSLAWLIARPGITAPISSATSLEQLTELIEATKLRLDNSSIELLNIESAF
jgi:aryl-alcohol dehydrogenase-like predicted oxidoreductase